MGDKVEVFASLQSQLYGWYLAQILKVERGFYFIHYLNFDESYDAKIQIFNMRKPNNSPPFNFIKVEKANIEVPDVDASELQPKLDFLRQQMALLMLRFDSKNITIIGQIPLHPKQQCILDFLSNKQQLNDFQSIRDRKNVFKTDIQIQKDLVGMVIGKAGANIQRIQAKFGVEIRVHQIEHPSNVGIEIVSESAQTLERVINSINYVHATVSVS